MRRASIHHTLIQAMASELQPKLSELADTAMEALKKQADADKDPLLALTIDIAADWVHEHGTAEAAVLIERLVDSMHDPKQASLPVDVLTAAELTKLTDTYQSAEAAVQINMRRSMRRVGSFLGEFARFAGQAFIATLAS